MPTVFFMSLFAFLVAIMGSIIVNSSVSRVELTQSLTNDTIEYFKTINTYVLQDVTPNHFEVVPRPWSVGFITDERAKQAGVNFMNRDEIRRLAPPSPDGNPLKDAWGEWLDVRVVREQVALDDNTLAPVSGVLMISAGPDRNCETSVAAPQTLFSYGQTVAVGDDIVFFFKDLEAQQNNYKRILENLKRIQGPLEQEFLVRLRAYRQSVSDAYQLALQTDPNTPQPDLVALSTTDQNFPRFANLSSATVRQSLGIENVFNELERLLPQGGRMRVVTLDTKPLEITFGVANDSINPSPWPVLGPRVTVRVSL